MNKNFYRHFKEMLDNHEKGWAVTVIETLGSGPGTLGMKMLINSVKIQALMILRHF